MSVGAIAIALVVVFILLLIVSQINRPPGGGF